MEDLLIGEVLKPQGIKGELKVKVFTDSPADIKKFGVVYMDGVAYKILSFRENAGVAYLGLRGIPDRNAAELLRGKTIEGERDDGPILEEGQYYIVDILGLSCETEEGEALGTVTDISNFSSDIYTIEKAGKKILFPAVKGVIKRVDLENKKLVVDKKIFDEIAVY